MLKHFINERICKQDIINHVFSVLATASTFCLAGHTQEVTTFPGFIATSTNSNANPRNRHEISRSCRYRLIAKRGQRVKVTQMTFNSHPGFKLASPSNCNPVAILRDPEGTGGVKRVCGSGVGEKHVMTSAGNELIVEVMMTSQEQDQADFLFQYQGILLSCITFCLCEV